LSAAGPHRDGLAASQSRHRHAQLRVREPYRALRGRGGAGPWLALGGRVLRGADRGPAAARPEPGQPLGVPRLPAGGDPRRAARHRVPVPAGGGARRRAVRRPGGGQPLGAGAAARDGGGGHRPAPPLPLAPAAGARGHGGPGKAGRDARPGGAGAPARRGRRRGAPRSLALRHPRGGDPRGADPGVRAVKLLALFWIFFRIGLVLFGGVFSVLPELQRALVDDGLITQEGFLKAFVLGQVVPGPNMAMCTVIGWHVAGLAGAGVAFVGIYSGPGAMMGAAYALYHRWRNVTWVRRMELAMRPVVLALLA